jgi:hypothetical protein
MRASALAGIPLNEIAARYGVTKQAVSFILKTKFDISVLEMRRAAVRARHWEKQRQRREVKQRRMMAAKAIDNLMASGISFSRAYAQILAEMGYVGSDLTLRALIKSVPRHGRFQRDLPERKSLALKLVGKGASLSQAALEARLAKSTVARLWREKQKTRCQ